MPERPVLVTGAGGVVGRFLVPFLAARGVPVIALLRRPGDRPTIPGVDWLVSPVEELSGLMPDIGMIVHAASTSPGPGVTVDQIVRDNIEATRRLIAMAHRNRVPRFLFLSAVSAYGQVNDPVVNETTLSVAPDSYGLSKRVGEELLKESGLPSLCLRLPAVVGPFAKRNWMVRIKAAILDGQAVEVFNPDAPYNNLLHLADLADLVFRLRIRAFPEYDRVVLGAAGEMPVIAAVRAMMDALGRQVELREMAERRSSFTIDSRRAQHDYGYSPMDIAAMIRRFASEPV